MEDTISDSIDRSVGRDTISSGLASSEASPNNVAHNDAISRKKMEDRNSDLEHSIDELMSIGSDHKVLSRVTSSEASSTPNRIARNNVMAQKVLEDSISDFSPEQSIDGSVESDHRVLSPLARYEAFPNRRRLMKHVSMDTTSDFSHDHWVDGRAGKDKALRKMASLGVSPSHVRRGLKNFHQDSVDYRTIALENHIGLLKGL